MERLVATRQEWYLTLMICHVARSLKLPRKLVYLKLRLFHLQKSLISSLTFSHQQNKLRTCGHATIATFVYLRELGRVTKSRTSKETIDGKREIFFEGGMAFMEQMSPKYSKVKNEEKEIRKKVKKTVFFLDNL